MESILLSSATRKSFYAQRPSEQAEVTGVSPAPSPSPGACLLFYRALRRPAFPLFRQFSSNFSDRFGNQISGTYDVTEIMSAVSPTAICMLLQVHIVRKHQCTHGNLTPTRGMPRILLVQMCMFAESLDLTSTAVVLIFHRFVLTLPAFHRSRMSFHSTRDIHVLQEFTQDP